MFKGILTEIEVVSLKDPKDIFKEFKKALKREDPKSTLLVENGDYYNSQIKMIENKFFKKFKNKNNHNRWNRINWKTID